MSDSEDEFESADEGEAFEIKKVNESPQETADDCQEVKSSTMDCANPSPSGDAVETTSSEVKDGEQEKDNSVVEAAVKVESTSAQPIDSPSKSPNKKSKRKNRSKAKTDSQVSSTAAVDTKTPDSAIVSEEPPAASKLSEPLSTEDESTLTADNPSDLAPSETSQSFVTADDLKQSQEKDSQQADLVVKAEEESDTATGSTKDEMSSQTIESTSETEQLEEPVSEDIQRETGEKDVSQLFDKLSMAAENKKEPARDSKEESVLEKLSRAGEKKQQASGWGSWGSWGSSILNTATSSINTFTGQVSEGMHTVVETFEASVGVPPAHELASDLSHHVKEPDEKEKVIPKLTDDESKDVADVTEETDETADGGDTGQSGENETAEDGSDWFSSWGVSGITTQLHSKTKGLVESGLDVLETIGKKTMEQIKETDPGYTKTKGMLRGNVTNLSQALREAREENDKRAAEESNAQPLASYSVLFDEHKGLLSLEALELQSIAASEVVSSKEDISEATQTKLDVLSDKFTAMYDTDEDNDESCDFEAGMDAAMQSVGISIKVQRILSVQKEAHSRQESCQQRQDTGERIEGREIHTAALNAFAELTSCAMEMYHKSAILLSHDLLGDNMIDMDAVTLGLVSVLKLVNNEITVLSHKFNECLNTAADDSENPDSINPMITDVFLEASNSTSYVKDAFKLLLPILQRFELSTEESEHVDSAS